MAAPVTTKAYKSRLAPDLVAASPMRLIREERLLVLRRVARWMRSHRYAPTLPDLIARYPDMGQAALHLRVQDLCAEGLAVRDRFGVLPTQEGWDLVGREPVEALFSSDANERATQYRMCHYVYESQRTPNFSQMYTVWLGSRHGGKAEA